MCLSSWKKKHCRELSFGKQSKKDYLSLVIINSTAICIKFVLVDIQYICWNLLSALRECHAYSDKLDLHTCELIKL